MRFSGSSEVLDDVDALGQFDCGGGNIAQFVVHFGGFGAHASHGERLQRAVNGERGDGEETKPPVDDERVRQKN